MSTTTQNLQLVVPANGDEDWDIGMDANLSKLDLAHGQLAAHNELNVVDMTNPASLTVDLTKGRIVHIDMAVSVTSCTITNATDGYVTFHITQPAGGGCSFTWPAAFKDAGEISTAAGTAGANTVSRQTFAYNSLLAAAYAVSPLITGTK